MAPGTPCTPWNFSRALLWKPCWPRQAASLSDSLYPAFGDKLWGRRGHQLGPEKDRSAL